MKFGMAGMDFFELAARQVVADGVRDDEIAVGEALHQRAGAQAVGAVIGKIRFADDEQAGDGRHQVVIHPQAAHGVVNRGINAHGDLIRIFAGDALVHFEEVAVALFDYVAGPGA